MDLAAAQLVRVFDKNDLPSALAAGYEAREIQELHPAEDQVRCRRALKICLVSSHGGHLTELEMLMEAFVGHELFYITYDHPHTRGLRRAYLLRRRFRGAYLRNMGLNPPRLILVSATILRIMLRERPDLVISTGAEIAIPAFYISWFLKIKTIFIESLGRVKTPSATGKLIYPVADLFLVQSKELLGKYGRRAVFKGAILRFL